MHGERPSAEYAKLRKESLESKFGHLLGTRSKNVSTIYHFGTFFALYRAAIISYHVLKLAIWRLFVHDMKKRSVKVIYPLLSPDIFFFSLGRLHCLFKAPYVLFSGYFCFYSLNEYHKHEVQVR